MIVPSGPAAEPIAAPATTPETPPYRLTNFFAGCPVRVELVFSVHKTPF
jgi:hypothetical protein